MKKWSKRISASATRPRYSRGVLAAAALAATLTLGLVVVPTSDGLALGSTPPSPEDTSGAHGKLANDEQHAEPSTQVPDTNVTGPDGQDPSVQESVRPSDKNEATPPPETEAAEDSVEPSVPNHEEAVGSDPRPELATAAPIAPFADELAAPEVVKVLSFNDRQDDLIDEFRADIILKLPKGFINPTTGVMSPVGGQYLYVGYDYYEHAGSIVPTATYKQIIGLGQAGANNWAKNVDQHYTVHRVIPAGDSDLLVMTIEGDRNILDNNVKGNVVGGLASKMNMYFSYGTRSTPLSTWYKTARTVYELDFWAYYGARGVLNITGSQVNIQYDATAALWSSGQASWGLNLDAGVNGGEPGVIPTNSFSVDIVNPAFYTAARGPVASIADSFWYAWVQEDGSLVDSINTAPIHVTGVPPRTSGTSYVTQISKNIGPIATAPQFGWTQAQADQGLTTKVSADGKVDLREAGGTGFYRLLVWPEARNPETISGSYGGEVVSYTASDLFDSQGNMTPRADLWKYTPATVYYQYSVPRPDAPHISVPTADALVNTPDAVTFSGTGTPGHTISLRLARGTTQIRDWSASGLITVIDGEHGTVTPSDVVVDASGNWSYTYTPAVPLADDDYTVVAVQTDQTPGSANLSSPMSNSQAGVTPAAWGVPFTIRTLPPLEATMVCPVSPHLDGKLSVGGRTSGDDFTVEVSLDGGSRVAAIQSGNHWSYVWEPGANGAPAIPDGSHTIQAWQMYPDGLEAYEITPMCTVQVANPILALGTKVVENLSPTIPGIVEAESSAWDILGVHREGTIVLDSTDPTPLKRGRSYHIEEHLVNSRANYPAAVNYSQLGETTCVDGDNLALPSSVFDPETSTLSLGVDTVVVAPVSCTLTNQTATVSFVTQMLGQQSQLPPNNWRLNVTSVEGGYSTQLNSTNANSMLRPGTANVVATVPEGFATIGLQQLDLATSSCVPPAASPETAAESCWLDISSAPGTAVDIPQGKHAAIRLIAATAMGLPGLPVTGGMGSWLFVTGGLAALIALTATYYFRRARALSLAADQLGGRQ